MPLHVNRASAVVRFGPRGPTIPTANKLWYLSIGDLQSHKIILTVVHSTGQKSVVHWRWAVVATKYPRDVTRNRQTTNKQGAQTKVPQILYPLYRHYRWERLTTIRVGEGSTPRISLRLDSLGVCRVSPAGASWKVHQLQCSQFQAIFYSESVPSRKHMHARLGVHACACMSRVIYMHMSASADVRVQKPTPTR